MMPDSPKAPPVDLNDVAARVAAVTGEPTSAVDIERVMASLQSVSSYWEAVALSGRTAQQVAETLRQLAAVEAVSFEAQKVALTPGGLALAWQHSLVPRKLYRCPHCEGRGLTLAIFQRAQARYEKVLEEWRGRQPGADGLATPVAVIALAAFLGDRGDLMGKEIAVVGDSTLAGVALALSGFPKRVVVVENAAARAAFLMDVIARDRIKLEIVDAASESAASQLLGQFSTVVVPELDEDGTAAAPLLRGAGAALVGCWSHADRPLAALARLEAAAQERGLVVTDLLRDFGAHDPAMHPHHPHEDDAEALKQPPGGVWKRPAVVRFERVA